MESNESAQARNADNVSSSTSPEHELSTGERFSQDLDKINKVIVEMLKQANTDPSDLREAWSIRAILAEEFIDSFEPTLDNPNPRPRVQFDLIVDKAMVFEAAGNNLKYLEELDAAESLALNSNLDEVAHSVGEDLDGKIQELGISPEELILKLRGVIEFSNRDYLRELLAEGIDCEDLIGTIYGMILEEGGDPDEVLTQLGVTE